MSDKEGPTAEKSSSNKQNSEISDAEKDLAQSALTEFSRNNFSTCLQHLNRLEATRPSDVKVLHNKIVAKYYMSELKETDTFRKGLHSVCQQAHVSFDDLDSLEDVEHCVLFYNQAVLLNQFQQLDTALNIMNKVFTFIEHMEEDLARRVYLLLIELHLSTHQPEKALSLIVDIENQFVRTDNAIEMMGGHLYLKAYENGHQQKAPGTSDAAIDAFRHKVRLYKFRCWLDIGTLNACKKQLRTILTPKDTPGTSDAAIDGFRHKVRLYKSRCWLDIGTLNACKKQLRTILTPKDTNLAQLSVLERFQYLQENYQEAMNILKSIPIDDSLNVFKETGQSPAMMFYNNMGCIHHYMGKPKLAAFYLQKALKENEAMFKLFLESGQGEPVSGCPLFCVGPNKAAALKYNLGVAQLHGGQPAVAFDCLVEAVQVYYINPKLWLRIAECCIMIHRKSNADSFDPNLQQKDLIQGVVGSGVHRKIILNPHFWKNSTYSSNAQSSATPVASLEFASLCLQNALVLLREEGVSVPAPPSPPIHPSKVGPLKASIIAASAYVSLCLEDPVIALEHAKALLAQPNLSTMNKILARLYAGEAYILLDKMREAVEILNPYVLAEINDTNVNPLCQEYPQNNRKAYAVFQYNLAVAWALKGHLDKASKILKQVWMSESSTCDVPTHVIALDLYIELLLGHPDVARDIIKQYFPQLQQ